MGLYDDRRKATKRDNGRECFLHYRNGQRGYIKQVIKYGRGYQCVVETLGDKPYKLIVALSQVYVKETPGELARRLGMQRIG